MDHKETTRRSDLARQALSERFLAQRRLAMERFVGTRQSSSAALDSLGEVRNLRPSTRLERLKVQ